MNGQLLKKTLFGFVYTFALCVSSIFCPITAFHIPVQVKMLLFVSALFSLLFSFFMSIRRGWIGVCAIFLLLIILCIHQWNRCTSAFFRVAEAVVPIFSSAFDLNRVFVLPEGMEIARHADAVLIPVCALIAAFCAYGFQVREQLAVSACAVLLPLIPCLVILETTPAIWAVVLLFGTLASLFLTQSIRRFCEMDANRLGAVLAVPLAVLIGLLLWISPPEQYERGDCSNRLQSGIHAAIEQLSFVRRNEQTGTMEFVSPFTPSTLGSRSWDSSVSRVDLRRVGPQKETGRHVMDVFSEVDGVFHLRAVSLGIYENNTWRAIPEDQFQDVDVPDDVFLTQTQHETSIRTVHIRTDMKASVYYLPYRPVSLPENAQTHTDAYVQNQLQATEYRVLYASPLSAQNMTESYRRLVYTQYTQLPDSLRASLSENALFKEFADANDHAADWYATQITALVQAGKTYRLDTPQIPDGEDFILWFLNESNSGYCVHFATAATILLRYCGVPARYVTGYYVSAKAGQWTAVTEDNAHAWVEYFDGTSWRILDPTPASPGSSSEDTVKDTDVPSVETDISNPEPENGKSETIEVEKSKNSSGNTAESNKKPVNFHPSTDSTADKEGERHISKGFLSVLLLLGIVGILFGYRILRLAGRKARLETGSTNRRAIMYHRDLAILSKWVHADIPEDLESIALKARFSQHRISAEELNKLRQQDFEWITLLMQEKNLWRRFVYRMIYVVY